MHYAPRRKIRSAVCACPTCGQQLPADNDLRVDLDENTVACSGRAIEFPARQTELVWFLRQRYPNSATLDSIIVNVWANVDLRNNTARHTISMTRVLLAVLGWGIKYKRGIGYRLVQVAATSQVIESASPPTSPAMAELREAV